MTTLRKGVKVPDFVLKDQKGEDIRLEDYRGKKVLLSFHPLAWTGVCTTQMQSLESNLQRLTELNVVPLGLSVDSTFTKHEWAKTIGIAKVHLLSDFWPHGGVAEKLGLFREKEGTAQRANVIIDEEGKVIFKKIYKISEVPDMKEILEFVESLE
jgi:peroxiredoxin